MRNPFGALLTLLPFFSRPLFGCLSHGHRAAGNVLDIPIDEKNDSLLTFDTLIIKVYSKDSAFAQEVFRGQLTDPKS